MAGGPNAAIAPCLTCAGPSDRTSSGLETDWFQCRECGEAFGIDFDGQPQPEAPLWPVSEERVFQTRMFAVMSGRRELITIGDFDGPLVFPPDKSEWTIGRHPDCDVQILSRSLAREHAVLSFANGRLALRDVASGTETLVREGEELTLGDVRMRVVTRVKI